MVIDINSKFTMMTTVVSTSLPKTATGRNKHDQRISRESNATYSDPLVEPFKFLM